MQLTTQKRIAADIMKVGINRVWFDPSRLEEIKEAITKADIRSLVHDKAIQARHETGNSRFRIRKNKLQKGKGRRTGHGSRKGKRTSRLPGKREWMNRIRLQRKILKELRDKEMITRAAYRAARMKAKGGYFRSRRHLQLYLSEAGLLKEEKALENKEKKNANTVQKKEGRKNELQ